MPAPVPVLRAVSAARRALCVPLPAPGAPERGCPLVLSYARARGKGGRDGKGYGLPRTKMSVPGRCAGAGGGELVMAVCVCLRLACSFDLDFGSEVCVGVSVGMR